MTTPDVRTQIKNSSRSVIKVGTSTLTHSNGKLDLHMIDTLCRIISDLENSGRQIVLVSSGAIGVGQGKLNRAGQRPKGIARRQAFAAIGQLELMFIYDKFFSEYNNTVAQILITADILTDPKSRKNTQNTFKELMKLGVIPIVNENDSVGTEELEGKNIGDNDQLSAYVAKLIGADSLILITDIDGLYSSNPRENPNAERIPVVREITPEIERLAGSPGSAFGTGGMATKIKAARISTEAGIPCSIISSSDPNNLYRIFGGEVVGTLFLPKE